MKQYVVFMMLSLAPICIAHSAFAQTRLDVSLEGPWILYEWKNFDGHNSMLLAMTPPVPGHYLPVFTTGDGLQIKKPGIYCVAFGATCTTIANVLTNPDPYPPTAFLPVHPYGGQLSWATVQSNATTFLLPMPNSISNDGIDPDMTTRRDISTPHGDKVQHPAIGVQLHYDKGPSSFDLFSCTGTPPSTVCTSSLLANPLTNYGTLRIMVKAEDHADTADPCDYHVKMAYHSMLMFMDPTQLKQHPPMPSGSQCANAGENSNQCIAYMGRSKETNDTNDACWVCDPQQDSIPSSCAYGGSYGHSHMGGYLAPGMENVLGYNVSPASVSVAGQLSVPVSFPDFGSQLASFDAVLSGLKGKLVVSSPPGNKQAIVKENGDERRSTTNANTIVTPDSDSCPSPDAGLPNLVGKFPTLSQLARVKHYLESKSSCLENRSCSIQKSSASNQVELSCDVALDSARLQSRALLSDVYEATKAGSSGKDCRAAVMTVQ